MKYTIIILLIALIVHAILNRKRKKKKPVRGWDFYEIKKQTNIQWFCSLPPAEQEKVIEKWIDKNGLKEWYCTRVCRMSSEDMCDGECISLPEREIVKMFMYAERR